MYISNRNDKAENQKFEAKKVNKIQSCGGLSLLCHYKRPILISNDPGAPGENTFHIKIISVKLLYS